LAPGRVDKVSEDVELGDRRGGDVGAAQRS
jgi:hypothetical protein